jgi:ABC-type Na+ efflux pump permease subunit
MSAVVEEKETRIAEILFSSAEPFQLMMGKLVGVALAALTQFAIWVISARWSSRLRAYDGKRRRSASSFDLRRSQFFIF